MISKIFEFLYDKIFVNIIVKKSTTLVYIEQYGRNKITSTKSKVFETITLSEEMVSFIKASITESPFYYISILDHTLYQGAFPVCTRKSLAYFKNVDSDEIVCIRNSWSVYTPKDELYAIERAYKDIGIDFVFSPFIVLSHIFKDKLDTKMSMFILIEEEKLSLSVFDDFDLVYAEYLSIAEDDEETLIDEEDEDDLDDDFLNDDFGLDDLDELDDLGGLDDMEELDDFGNIEDLDSLDDIDEFSDAKEISQSSDMEESNDSAAANFQNDYQRFLTIQDSVNNFYKSEKYKSEFVENVYLADTVGIGDLKRYLEDEMFMNVFTRKISIEEVLSEIARLELAV